MLDWDGTSEAWTCHLAHERLSFKVYLQADGRSRMFPFETAGRQIEALLAELESLRQRVEVKANENVVVDHAAFESNEPIKLDGAHWSKAHLAELWVSCWGEIEAYFSTDALPDGTYLVAVIDRQGRVEGVARRVRHPDLGDAG